MSSASVPIANLFVPMCAMSFPLGPPIGLCALLKSKYAIFPASRLSCVLTMHLPYM